MTWLYNHLPHVRLYNILSSRRDCIRFSSSRTFSSLSVIMKSRADLDAGSSKKQPHASSSTKKQLHAGSSSNPPVQKTFKFPRKSFASLVYMENFLKHKVLKNVSLSLALEKCGDGWKSLFLSENLHLIEAFEIEAEKGNVEYMKNYDSFTKWKSMSATEKAPYIAKAKTPYLGKLAAIKETMTEAIWGKGVHLDWDVDKDFDTFGFFVFCEGLEKDSKERYNSNPFCIFFDGFINQYKVEHPCLGEVDTKEDEWWKVLPQDVLNIADKTWSELTEDEKATYVNLAEEAKLEELTNIFAFEFFTVEFPDCEPVQWEKLSTEEKAPYLSRGKAIAVQFMEEGG